MRKIIPPNFHQQKSSIHISWKFPRLTEISPTADRDLGQAGNIFSYEWIFSVERNNLISTMQAQKNIKEFKMGHEQATSATSTCKKSGKNFRWEEKHVEDLINWQTVDVKIFRPVNVTDFNENTKSNVDQNKNIETIWKEEKELMIRGRNGIIEKVKDIPQNFS